jgi:hypothetical protein
MICKVGNILAKNRITELSGKEYNQPLCFGTEQFTACKLSMESIVLESEWINNMPKRHGALKCPITQQE